MLNTTTPLTVYKASAGSGKTFTLATEYITLLVRNPLSYRHILAVTFTNKATEEMKMRILTHLYGICHGLKESESYARKVAAALGNQFNDADIALRAGQALQLLLHNYSHFHVETIDSFFQSVLRNMARELNLTATLHVGLNDTQVEDAAVDKLIDSLSTTDLRLQWLLSYIMDNISDDRSWNVIGQIKRFGLTIFRDYYKKYSVKLNELMQQQGFFDSYQATLRRLRQQSKERMADIANQFFQVLEAENLTIDDFSYSSSGVAGLFVKLRNGIFDESVLTKRVTDSVGQPERWYKKSHPRRQHIHLLADSTLDSLLRTAINEQPRQWKLYKSADLTLQHLGQLRLLGSIEHTVRQLNDQQNRFLLSDTQQLLHDLIDGSDSPFIFEKMGTQLEHIMIDEFQDTSTVQWQNFKVLLQETMSHQGTHNLIVGDVKQSIYRWRSGDWHLLANIAGEFSHAEENVHIETLSTNFRSASRIVSFNNAFFTQAAQIEQVAAYDDVVQHMPPNSADEGQVCVTLLPQSDYQQLTLDAVATQVSELLDQGVPAASIAILVRTNSYIPLIANHLMAQLPTVKVVSDEAFRLDASPAVNTLVQAMRYLVNPDDVITRASLALTFSGQVDGPLPQDFTPQLLQLPLLELAEQLFAVFQLNSQHNQSAYVSAFFDQLRSFAADAGSDIPAFISEWDQTIGAKTIQSPETDGLRIISIHKSKGLEFPCVLVPFCDWRLEQFDILWCTPPEEPFSKLPLVPVDYSLKGMKGTIYEAACDEEHQQATVDNLNLLYVAFTRASRQLYVWGRRKAPSSSRSALLESVLPLLDTLQGATLTGSDDESQPLVFSYDAPHTIPTSPKTAAGATAPSANPFLRPSTPVHVNIEVLAQKVSFKQSTQSRLFATPDGNDGDDTALHNQYIQLGNVLHHVLATIRSTDDIDTALQQLEYQGILTTGQLTRQQVDTMLRKRLNSAQVSTWFQPGRWQLYNECSILSTDPATGLVERRRPDRVMTDGKQTIVVDFKFGNERPEYHDQVRLYMDLLQRMGHNHVSGFLWLVYSNTIIPVTPAH